MKQEIQEKQEKECKKNKRKKRLLVDKHQELRAIA